MAYNFFDKKIVSGAIEYVNEMLAEELHKPKLQKNKSLFKI